MYIGTNRGGDRGGGSTARRNNLPPNSYTFGFLLVVLLLMSLTVWKLQIAHQLAPAADTMPHFELPVVPSRGKAQESLDSRSLGRQLDARRHKDARVIGGNTKAATLRSSTSALLTDQDDSSSGGRRTRTDSLVDASDQDFYTGIDWGGNSSTATVMGMATGYGLGVFQQFVGSLRNSGYEGHIILGVAPDVPQTVLDYFRYRRVTPKILRWVNCTYAKSEKEARDIFKKTHCSHPYPDIKIRWSRFPLQRDWLLDCPTCTGPVLVTDVRDTVFQRNPFGPGSPMVQGLQVFEEHVSQTTQHWLTHWPIRNCKNMTFVKPMLCSGTTIGTRKAMLKYLEIMYEEMKVWISAPQCRFDINGDDQSIHNYLFYTGQLPFATALPQRSGAIVNTVGKEAALIWKEHYHNMMRQHGVDEHSAKHMAYPNATAKNWIGLEYNVTNPDGLLIEADGSISRVVHQWDRYGVQFSKWLQNQPFAQDPWPLPNLRGLPPL